MIIEKEFEDFVFKIALENAVSYNGEANAKALLGKIIPNFPEMKEDMKHYMQLIENIVSQVNEMKPEEKKRKLLDINPKFFEEKENKKGDNKKKQGELPELKNVKGKIRVRTEPAPSGQLHLGHLFNIVFNYEYTKKYGGEFIVRFGDTNPDNIAKENYDKILNMINWITDNGISEIYYQSDRLALYYKYLRQLIETGNAYVCKCDSETFKAFNDSSTACPHRNIPVAEQLKEYEKMLNGETTAGDAAIRFKGDLENKNPALRDFPIARINENEHPRVGKKYRLWPMMNLVVAIDDIDMKLTHVIRGKDHEINMDRQLMVIKALGMQPPEYYHLGRMQFEDLILSKTQLSKAIAEGVYEGWDDPRIATLESFRKRGYTAEGFRRMILAGGISKRDSRITEAEYLKALDFFNKQVLEEKANRFFFVHDVKNIKINNINEYPEKEILMPIHPDFKDRGNRKYSVIDKYLIDGIDFDNIEKGDLIRLMHFGNFNVVNKTEDTLELEFVSKEFSRDLKLKRNIHFCPTIPQEQRNAIIVMQNNQKIKGITGPLMNPKVGDAIQFERFGFVRFDHVDNEGNRVFYFTHR